jgi:hypothetical protein
MPKTLQQLEKECNSAIKLILLEMETLAALPPEQASSPVVFNERRERVIRKVWGLFKECLVYDPGEVQRNEHP